MNIDMPRSPGEMEAKKKVKIVDNRVRDLPEMNIESLEDEKTGKIEVGLAEAGSRGEVAESTLEVSQKNRAERVEKARENAAIIATKKLEAGMEPDDLKDMLEGQLEEVEDNIESLEDDQSVMLDEAVTQRENIMAQLQAVEKFKAEQKEAA